MKMTLSREKVDIQLATRLMTITQLANAYGCSRARMNVILNSRQITPMCAGRLAKALKCSVNDVIE
jgi:DNA-binding Xre family transcriptional regulator